MGPWADFGLCGCRAVIGDLMFECLKCGRTHAWDSCCGEVVPRAFTTSELRLARRCREKWRYRYALRLKDDEDVSPAISLGTRVHEALEKVWAGLEPEFGDTWEELKAEALIEMYRELYDLSGYEVLGVEVPFEFVRDGCRLKGKIDAIAKNKESGHYFIVEHKTTSSSVDPDDLMGHGIFYWQLKMLDDQVLNYLLGARSLGFDVKGCLYDAIRTPSIKEGPGKGDVDKQRERLRKHIKPSFFHQKRLIPDEARIQSHWALNRRLIQELSATTPTVPQDRNYSACGDFHRMCEFRRACLTDSTSSFRKGSRHPELAKKKE